MDENLGTIRTTSIAREIKGQFVARSVHKRLAKIRINVAATKNCLDKFRNPLYVRDNGKTSNRILFLLALREEVTVALNSFAEVSPAMFSCGVAAVITLLVDGNPSFPPIANKAATFKGQLNV